MMCTILTAGDNMENLIDVIYYLFKMFENDEEKKAEFENELIDYIKTQHDIEFLYEISPEGHNMISTAVEFKLENFLITVLKTYPEFVDKKENDFPIFMALYNCQEVCKTMLRERLDLVSVKDSHGDTFLHYCARRNQQDVLIEAVGINPNIFLIKNESGESIYDIAKNKNLIEVEKTFEGRVSSKSILK